MTWAPNTEALYIATEWLKGAKESTDEAVPGLAEGLVKQDVGCCH